MAHEGMVHALHEIHRVLIPDGVLIDLRPVSDRWPIEVFSARETCETGRVSDLPLGLEDDQAANQSMIRSEANGWFLRDQETFFRLNYVWDTPSDMEKWIDKEWENFITIGEDERRTTRSTWAVGDADSRVRVRAKMLIAKYRKLE